MKKSLTKDQEFEIMKLVLDKFLWLGIGIMAYGLYRIFVGFDIVKTIVIMIAGAIVLILFMVLLLKEFQVSK